MSLTSWKTWASGDVLTAADMNTYLRDNGRWLSHNSTLGAPMCRVYNNATLASWTSGNPVTFNSERFDLASMHDTASNTSRITIPASSGGKYLVGSHLRVDPTSTPTDGVGVSAHRINATTEIAHAGFRNADDSAAYRLSLTSLYSYAAADYVEVTFTFTNFGTPNITIDGNASPEFWAIWLGE